MERIQPRQGNDSFRWATGSSRVWKKIPIGIPTATHRVEILKRTLFFGNPYSLSVDKLQLRAKNKNTEAITSVPIEDIGCIVLEHPQITFTQHVIQQMAEHNVAVVFCDTRYYPCSMLFHLDTHYMQTARFALQINATEPRKKQLWQQIIKAKIINQAALLDSLRIDSVAVKQQARKVKSGDSTYAESQAARLYWPLLFGSEFTRERFGELPNPALNYGYAILRAAVARALAGSGLLSTIGIHHHNKYNSFCLADDVMEPYRPYVDSLVHGMYKEGLDCKILGIEAKKRLLGVLHCDTIVNGTTSPLMIAVTHTATSLVKCFEKVNQRLIYPQFL